ncbi:MAG: hypothetical protein LUG18_02665 [Candidatus Azobacteroides sp.]|nr:hypothetical protein [Candidatus Azobacteroides sp.]
MLKKTYIFLFILAPVAIASADPHFMMQLLQCLEVYNKYFPEEKIYLQTDKTFYKQAEKIWYKGWLVNSEDNKPSRTSSVAYVELQDPKGNVIQRHEQQVTDGSFHGDFYLSGDISGGLYKIVAYTNWMKNLDERLIFEKEITVQKVITPRLLLRLEFKKRAYGPGDEVVAELFVTDLKNNKTQGSQLVSQVRINGIPVFSLNDTVYDGEAKIRFRLPEDLSSSDGILQIRVNERGIEESITRSIPIEISNINLSFYPEGGDMIANVKSRIAFQALNEFGKGVDVQGKILDENETEVARFESFHLGMGAFEFTPLPGKKYTARIERPLGTTRQVSLPEILSRGYSFHLSGKDNNKTTWTIYSPENGIGYLVGQTGGVVYETRQVQLTEGYNTMEIPMNNFPAGVAVFTLFDATEKEVCERLVFVNPHKGLKITLKPDKEVYEPEDFVKLLVRTYDKENDPVSATIGISVVDEQLLSFADDKQDNILSYLFFSSELKGQIQEPSFYFDENQPKAEEAIDYLMLTHGWRRFTWQQIRNPSNRVIPKAPEKAGEVYGYVLDSNYKPVETEVYLIEYGGKRRIAKVKTTPEGQFAFKGVSFDKIVKVITKKPNVLYLFSGKPVIPSGTFSFPFSDITAHEAELMTVVPEEEELFNIEMEEPVPPFIIPYVEDEVAFMLADGMLEESVVVGYGSQKRALTGAVKTVYANEINTTIAHLFGKLNGISVVGTNLNPGREYLFSLRGFSSFGSGTGYPAILFDGIPLSDPLGIYVSGKDLFSLNGIGSMSFSKSPSYIHKIDKANNGGIFIFPSAIYLPNKSQKPLFNERNVTGRQFYKPSVYQQENDNLFRDNTTVYWNPDVKTNKKGEAVLTFVNNRNSSSFRITAEGISPADGLIGNTHYKISTQKPFAIDVKTPVFANFGDTVMLPVMVTNSTDKVMDAKVMLSVAEELTGIGEMSRQALIEPRSSHTFFLGFSPGQKEGTYNYRLHAVAGAYHEMIEREISVRSVYFPQQYSFSGRKMEDSLRFRIPENYIKGSLRAEVVCYTNVMDELFAGMESIFREPYGCFEQASSSTFPNIMALQLMEETQQVNPDLRTKALSLLDKGYRQLASYEVKGGGFEWFGKDPAHIGLTAYGLLEFHEMEKVYDHVDQDMTARARNFVLGRRDNKGGFNNNTRGYDHFSGSPKNISDAYIVYALSEVKESEDISREYRSSLDEALRTKDLYRMALMANAAYNLKDMESYTKLIAYFAGEAEKTGFEKMKMGTSIVRSSGISLIQETVALWAIALLKSPDNPYPDVLDKCIEYISSGRTAYGGFGNTQSTVLCLQALVKYAAGTATEIENGWLDVMVNGKLLNMDLTQATSSAQPFRKDISAWLDKEENEIRLAYHQVENSLPYGVSFLWDQSAPSSSPSCPLLLTTKLNSHTVKRNETVRLTVTMQNKKNEGLPMSIAIIGIPGGMSLQPWQLKELVEKEVIDFYEIMNDNLMIYYRSLKPNDKKVINLDLKAEIPGTYTGMASTTYVYYTNENKYWINGFTVKITE